MSTPLDLNEFRKLSNMSLEKFMLELKKKGITGYKSYADIAKDFSDFNQTYLSQKSLETLREQNGQAVPKEPEEEVGFTLPKSDIEAGEKVYIDSLRQAGTVREVRNHSPQYKIFLDLTQEQVFFDRKYLTKM